MSTMKDEELAPEQEPYSEEQGESTQNSRVIVGIGTSAGGLEALQNLFDNYTAVENMGFVIVQHLSPDYKSLMVELLSKHTRMEVFQVIDGIEVKANCVYVMPSKKNLAIKNGKLYLMDKPRSVSVNFPIDIFFHSLGIDQKEKAIAIVLSGTGTDGSRGIKTIKENGGIVMVQEPASAKFNGMPISAISTKLVDYVLTPKDISFELPTLAKLTPVSLHEVQVRAITSSELLLKILRLILETSGIDFSLYKRNTIFRRIDRRIKLKKLENMELYYDFLKENAREVEVLGNDLLIGVTQFFRDVDAFEELTNNVIPEIFANKTDDQLIRIWTPGCSTGEEAYSIAMLFAEYKQAHKRNNSIKIFATDIDPNAIDIAGSGTYPINIVVDVPPNLLSKYFINKENGYTVTQELRNQIVFAKHNILADPPFNRVDLIVCRNLLIYMDAEPQTKILSVFQFALNRKGFLFLGPSESVGEIIKYMRPVNKRWKIYQSTTEGRSFLPEMLISAATHPTYTNYTASLPPQKTRKQLTGQMIDLFKDALVDRFSPMTAFLNTNLEVLYLAGGINRFIRLPERHLSLNVLKMLPEAMVIPMNTATRKVMKTGKPVRYESIAVDDTDGVQRAYDLQVEMLKTNEAIDQVLIVSVYLRDEEPRVEGEKALPVTKMASERIEYLEHQLKDTRDSLQSTIEELETSNEELQASNEELMAANEELQSTNEELQSVNEELHTVNSELQAKIMQLTEMTNDMDNLLKSTDIGTIFLDEELRIRKFTPAIREQFKLIEQDIGRPIGHFNTDLGDVDVVSIASNVLNSGHMLEQEIVGGNGTSYLMRILPYRTDEGRAAGVVVTFTDIEELTNRLTKTK